MTHAPTGKALCTRAAGAQEFKKRKWESSPQVKKKRDKEQLMLVRRPGGELAGYNARAAIAVTDEVGSRRKCHSQKGHHQFGIAPVQALKRT